MCSLGTVWGWVQTGAYSKACTPIVCDDRVIACGGLVGFLVVRLCLPCGGESAYTHCGRRQGGCEVPFVRGAARLACT